MRYIPFVACRFSRWTEATPTPGPDSRSVAKFLCEEVFPRFCLPDTISSDNGPHFVAEVIKTTTKMLGIEQKFGCVYHPNSQGSVDRANGTLKAKLAKTIADSQNKSNWMQALPLVLMYMRSQTDRLTHQCLCHISEGHMKALHLNSWKVSWEAISNI